ncbi:hypothetical protein BDBG_02842 [Blastomyces gilchristii SLH14081]|uniref:Uncharacterized protein n=1 Tax=Blastomyces gilchristii (strain SLH14081) TaxID=559298 RepID=A0A179UHD0_BLAGS|nr:uncharacterized protein BDBG_02842 [Blastomyces gilchristii SLH14081]OAT06668.1 hypothetical protein BDBG_02842 [Blastomyces gilchristii SLH14081]
MLGVPRLIGPSTSSALVVTELFCPSSLQVMRPLSVSPAVVNMHGFDPRMDLRIPNKYPGHLTVPRDILGVCPRSPLSPRTESTERSHYGEPLKGATERSTVLCGSWSEGCWGSRG